MITQQSFSCHRQTNEVQHYLLLRNTILKVKRQIFVSRKASKLPNDFAVSSCAYAVWMHLWSWMGFTVFTLYHPLSLPHVCSREVSQTDSASAHQTLSALLPRPLPVSLKSKSVQGGCHHHHPLQSAT